MKIIDLGTYLKSYADKKTLDEQFKIIFLIRV